MVPALMCHCVIDVGAEEELRLFRQGRINRCLIRCEGKRDRRDHVVCDRGELFLALPLSGEGTGCCERRLFGLALHARARVDYEHDAKLLRIALAYRCHDQTTDRLAVLEHADRVWAKLLPVGQG
jgi:hypothetical protein